MAWPGGPQTLSQFVGAVLALEGTPQALTAEQKTRVLAIVRKFEENSRRMGDATVAITRVLNDRQLPELSRPHRPPDFQPTEFSPGKDPMIERAISLLEKKAASSAASPTSSPTGIPMGRGGNIVMGVVYLESVRELALSPTQARTALDNLRIMRKEFETRSQLERQLNGVFDARQQETVTKSPIAYGQGELDAVHLLPSLMVRWLEGASSSSNTRSK